MPTANQARATAQRKLRKQKRREDDQALADSLGISLAELHRRRYAEGQSIIETQRAAQSAAEARSREIPLPRYIYY